jgi:hypothetical protein
MFWSLIPSFFLAFNGVVQMRVTREAGLTLAERMVAR